MLKSIEIAQFLLEKVKKEVESLETDKNGNVKMFCGSRETIKRKCVVIRQLVLEVKKGLEFE